MIYTRKIMQVGRSKVLVIPPEIIKEMKLIKGEVMVIKTYRGKLQATRLRDYVRKKEGIGANE